METEREGGRACCWLSGYHPGPPVNGFGRSGLAGLRAGFAPCRARACGPAGRLRPLTAPLRGGAGAPGNPARIHSRNAPMSTSTDLVSQKLAARQVRDDERIETLPRHFGRYMMRVEDAVYTFMRELAQEYRGGYWHFYELSNGVLT